MKRRYVIAALGFFLAFAPAARGAQPEKIINTIDESINTRQETQKKSAAWQAKQDRLKSRYFQLKEAVDLADVEVKHLQEIIDKQDAYIERTRRRVLEMEKIRQRLVPYLNGVIARMEHAIAADLPFLPEERRDRVAALKDIVNDPEVPLGEKLRRVFEGLRVEMDYGKSVETTKEEIQYQGQKLLANVLRIGRTALIMQTLDEAQIGIYDGKGWVQLSGEYKNEIKKAIEITQRRRPVEFVNLPLRGAQQ